MTDDFEGFGPDFDGETYVRAIDNPRLTTQLARVRELLSDGYWWTLGELEQTLDYKFPQASISARLRDLRKPKFGGHTIDRRRGSSPGLFEYRMSA